MSYFLNETIFETLNKIDLDENLDPSIDGEELLYEDNDYSKTPGEADKYRTDTEEVLGFELNGNQVQYLATNWSEFYHNAKENSDMKGLIIKKLNQSDDTKLSDKQKESKTNSMDFDFEDDIDYHEDNPDALHPYMNNNIENTNSQPTKFKPLNVQSWDTPKSNKEDVEKDPVADINDMANEVVYGDDIDDDIDPVEVNKILTKES